MECRAIGRRCATGSATMLGDIAQGTTPWATTSWESLLFHLGQADAGLRVLTTGYRVPRQILDFASRLLPAIAPGLAPATLRAAGRRDPWCSARGGRGRAARGAGRRPPRRPCARPGSAAVIAADDQVAAVSACWPVRACRTRSWTVAPTAS